MAIPNNYIDKITDNDNGESRLICPAAENVRVGNEHFDCNDLDEVLDELAGGIGKAGQVNEIVMNGQHYTPTNKVIDLGTVITQHQDISGKADKATTYTKTETDNAIANAVEGLGGGSVESVTINGVNHEPINGVVDLGDVQGEPGPQGPKGDTVVVGGEQEFSISNDFDGGEADALSGAMGKVVAGREATDRERIDEIVAILKKAVFTEGVSFANLDALATATDSIYLDKSSYAFNGIGGTMRLVAHVDPSTATSNIEWSSSNTSVATVTSDGTVVAIADGSAVITARDTISGKTATCSITVQQFVPNSVTISQAAINSDGEHWKTTKQLTASTDPAGGTISWSILPANSHVATVNNGLVTLLANGQCTVRASCGNKYADCAVDVQNLVRTSYSIAKTLDNASVSPNDANVLEGEDITLTITADASHVLDSVTVEMGETDLSDSVEFAEDNKSASIDINNVSGDITIVATATFVETNLMDGATAIQGTYIYGDTIYENQGAGYISKRVKLEKGKLYKIKNYSPTGTSGFDAVLLKDDGNGGYERVTSSDIDTLVGLWALNNSLFRVNNNSQVYYRSFGTAYNYPYSEMVFGTPTEDELPDVDIYLFIDTKNGNNNEISSDFGLYEWSPKATLDFTELYGNWTPRANLYSFGESYGTTAVIKLTKGVTYDFDGYTQFAQTTNNVFALLRKVDGVFKNLTSADLANGVNWNGNNGFFTASGSTTNIGKTNVPLSGSFTVPSDSDVAGDLYLAVAVSSSASDSVASTLTITKQTQS